MLYYINELVVDAAESGDATVIERLKDLHYCWRKGKCLINSSRNNFRRLSLISELAECYRQISQYAQDIHSLYKDLKFFVVLTIENKTTDELSEFRNKISLVNIREFNDICYITNNFLACEDTTDIDFYKWGTDQLMIKDIKEKFHLNILPCNGGGCNIGKSIEHVDEFFCLAICDSDHKYPGCDDGETLANLKDFLSSHHYNNVLKFRM